MTHIKKYLVWYILGLVVIVLIAYQFKLFGNTKTLFRGGGRVSGGGLSAWQTNFGSSPIITGRVTCVDSNGNVIHRFGSCRQEGGNPCANVGNGICID